MYVVVRSPRPGPDGYRGSMPRLRVAAPPEDGKANAEVERVMTHLLGEYVKVVAGLRARAKTLEVPLSEQQVAERLRRAFGSAEVG